MVWGDGDRRSLSSARRAAARARADVVVGAARGHCVYDGSWARARAPSHHPAGRGRVFSPFVTRPSRLLSAPSYPGRSTLSALSAPSISLPLCPGHYLPFPLPLLHRAFCPFYPLCPLLPSLPLLPRALTPLTLSAPSTPGDLPLLPTLPFTRAPGFPQTRPLRGRSCPGIRSATFIGISSIWVE